MRTLLLLLPAFALLAAPAVNKPVTNFKESGSPSAPITLELFTDYQCPSCRMFYQDVLPQIVAQYVKTGKVRLIHRDYPLPMHAFSRIATKFANAAGQLGLYDTVAAQIFKTQPEWEQNGNIDGQLSKVLSPADLEKIKSIMKTDTHLDDSVTKDVAMGNQDHLSQTPTIVIVANGKREVIGGGVPYPILKQYLNQKLGK